MRKAIPAQHPASLGLQFIGLERSDLHLLCKKSLTSLSFWLRTARPELLAFCLPGARSGLGRNPSEVLAALI